MTTSNRLSLRIICLALPMFALPMSACLGAKAIGSLDEGDSETSDGDSNDGDSSDDGPNDGDSSDGDSSDGDSNDGDSNDGDSNDGDSDSGNACGIEFEEPAPGTFSTLHIRNERDSVIYVPYTISGCAYEPFAVHDGDTQLFWFSEGNGVIPTCETIIPNGCFPACKDDGVEIYQIAPGGEIELTWGLYVWAPVELDAACVEGTSCQVGDTCWAGRAWVEDGPLTASLRVTETCQDGIDCDCGPDDSCAHGIDSIAVQAWTTDVVQVEFDAGHVGDIDIVID